MQKKQGLPEKTLYEIPERPRPLLLAIARDVPAYCKSMVYKEVTQAMPGIFVTLDQQEHMGLDMRAMQDILDSKKNIIVNVDHGLTRLTRENFIRNFELNTQSLIPKPTIVLVIGDDINKKMTGFEHLYGVHGTDLDGCRDQDLKVFMQYTRHCCLLTILIPY